LEGEIELLNEITWWSLSLPIEIILIKIW